MRNLTIYFSTDDRNFTSLIHSYTQTLSLSIKLIGHYSVDGKKIPYRNLHNLDHKLI